MTTQTTNFDRAAAMMDTLPQFQEDAKRLAVELSRQLARGEPVQPESLAAALGVPTSEIRTLLEDEQLRGWVFNDDEHRIVGFRGLAIPEMPHKFEVQSRTLYTWCALDSLFIPEIIGKDARVESRDPQTGTVIRLTVTPDGIEAPEPATTVVSVLVGDTDVLQQNPAKIMGTFCHHIFFFSSVEEGQRWAADRDNVAIHPVQDAYQFVTAMWSKVRSYADEGPLSGKD